jgi:hypothetical protein
MTDNNEVLDVADRRGRGRPKSHGAEARLHVSMPQSLKDRLEGLQEDTHASSIAEVVKNALALYAAAVDLHNKGGCLLFKDEKGVERQLTLFLSPSKPKAAAST